MKLNYRYLVIAVIPISIFFACSYYLQTSKTPWVDECYTYYGVTHESWNGFLESICSGVNFSPPLYFLINWIIQLFLTISIESLRIESAIYISIGVFLVFYKCAKLFNKTSAFLGCTLILIQSDLLLEQAMEARHYGLFFACSAWVLLLIPNNQSFNSTRHKILYFVAHFSLCCTHYVGIIFSTITGIARYLHKNDRRFSANLPVIEIYACALALPIYIFLLSHQSSHLGNWPKPNGLSALLDIYCDSLTLIIVVVPLFIAIMISDFKLKRTTTKIFPLVFVVVAWLLIPLICWIVSHTSNLNLLKDRYFIGKEAALMVLVSFLFHKIFQFFTDFQKCKSRILIPICGTLLFCVCLMFIISKRKLYGLNPIRNYYSKLLTTENIISNKLPKVYFGDHLFFPNKYLNQSVSNLCLSVPNEKLNEIYSRFNPLIKTQLLSFDENSPYIFILDKKINPLTVKDFSKIKKIQSHGLKSYYEITIPNKI